MNDVSLTKIKLGKKMPNEIKRLDTQESHYDFLRHAFETAKNKILIVTYGINHETMTRARMYWLIFSARKRNPNLGIYIYCGIKNNENVPEFIINFFRENGVFFAYTHTHAKVLAVDKKQVVLGSFNWLSDYNKKFNPNENASFLYSGSYGSSLIDDIWERVKLYKTRTDLSATTIQIAIDLSFSNLIHLSTLAQHREFIGRCFQYAKNRIIICSPFIDSNSYIDFIPERIQNAANRGIKIYFICLSEQIHRMGFHRYIDQTIQHPNVVLIEANDIHLKSMIIDDNVIAEGSFNWLSASRNESRCNQEETLVVEGEAAKPLVWGFIRQTRRTQIGDKLLTPETIARIQRPLV